MKSTKQKQKELYKESAKAVAVSLSTRQWKYLAKLTRQHRDSIQINNVINEKGDIATEMEEFKEIIRS